MLQLRARPEATGDVDDVSGVLQQHHAANMSGKLWKLNQLTSPEDKNGRLPSEDNDGKFDLLEPNLSSVVLQVLFDAVTDIVGHAPAVMIGEESHIAHCENVSN